MSLMIENKIPISITANAIKEINRLLQIESNNGKGLRIGVRGGGCAGFTYILDFDMQKENDQIYTLNEFPIFIDKSQELYLHDCEIDFKGGLDNRGFVFNNPNATTTCGCGTSFSA
jgi:iron-sulfur cluster assembly protein